MSASVSRIAAILGKEENMTTLTPEVRSFHHLADLPECPPLCRGTACFAARARNIERWRMSTAESPAVYCLGECYVGPAVGGDVARPRVAVFSRATALLGNVAAGGARSLRAYRARGGYRALEIAVEREPAALIEAVERSELRGRGGAAFPAGRKWRAVAAQADPVRRVVANADEGDPGAYIDRFLMEDDPHRLIEGMTLAALGVGADRGVIYLRREYPAAAPILREALAEARQSGWLGASVAGSTHRFDIDLVIGHGGYVCGEETSLLQSIMGRRPDVQARPPYPFEHGLDGHPTLVHNVETLCALPYIVEHGGAAWADLGIPGSRGNKCVSLNSLFRTPGLYEVEFGVPLRTIVEEYGGGLDPGPLTALLVGGPLAGLLPPSALDTPFGFEEMAALGAAVGHGGIVAFDATSSIRDIVDHVLRFAVRESCGKCFPCRLGTAALLEALESGGLSHEEWRRTVTLLADGSLCGLGTGVADFARSIDRHFAKEFAPCRAS
jgi:NADH:ubiquinone oxidoreductase subunit F (NADH-binding)